MNEREARDIRFLVLLGMSHGEIAEWLGRNRKAVDRIIREKGLLAPERPLELAWLTLRHAYEELAEAMADGREWDVGKLAKLNSEMRLTEAAMWAAGVARRRRIWGMQVSRMRMLSGKDLKPLSASVGWTALDYRVRAMAMWERLNNLPEELQAHLRQNPFVFAARDTQVPPRGPWRTWVFMGGRGAGKTRAATSGRGRCRWRCCTSRGRSRISACCRRWKTRCAGSGR
ncbi:hypothetical protein [Hyphomonas chukchiensis]|uniref:Uncharacterized protein n=1 Tax=Hyphomonas chukchiensis TaxID=1280947 RepID=A0A062UCX6_9PROT|nr:hypothetical protein [Hyphomonas chukchiensis]KCZ58910.1 hypothetical protein HY30_04000 [Hyphomonas chukchiensis]